MAKGFSPAVKAVRKHHNLLRSRDSAIVLELILESELELRPMPALEPKPEFELGIELLQLVQ